MRVNLSDIPRRIYNFHKIRERVHGRLTPYKPTIIIIIIFIIIGIYLITIAVPTLDINAPLFSIL